jgi:Ni/Fe-hydrogenase subunit HybB-like protein
MACCCAIWLDYRRDIVHKSQTTTGTTRLIYRALRSAPRTSARVLRIDERLGYFITVMASLPHSAPSRGIFGSQFSDRNASALMPIVFIFSAMVSGIAAVMLLYMLSTRLRGRKIDIRCLDTIAQYLFYVFVIDFSLEMLDLLQRIYEADESFRSLDFMVHTRLWMSQVIVQILLGTVAPIVLLGLTQVLASPASANGLRVCRSSPSSASRHALERGSAASFLQKFSRIHYL